MKLLLTILLFPVFCFSQQTFEGFTAITSISNEAKAIQQDTIQCTILYSDNSIVNDAVHSKLAYEVREKYCCIDGNNSIYLVYQPVPYYTHLLFLDIHKKPFPKNIIIWLSK